MNPTTPEQPKITAKFRGNFFENLLAPLCSCLPREVVFYNADGRPIDYQRIDRLRCYYYIGDTPETNIYDRRDLNPPPLFELCGRCIKTYGEDLRCQLADSHKS